MVKIVGAVAETRGTGKNARRTSCKHPHSTATVERTGPNGIGSGDFLGHDVRFYFRMVFVPVMLVLLPTFSDINTNAQDAE
jgi:hypothetical protein